MNHRLIAGLTSAIMSMNMLTILPMQAFALGTEITVYEKGCTIFGTPKFTRAEDYTIIKNNGYNYEIEAGQIRLNLTAMRTAFPTVTK